MQMRGNILQRLRVSNVALNGPAGTVNQSERDLERHIQSLLDEASLGQWVEALDAEKARELLIRMKDCSAKAGASGFRLGQMQLQWAVGLIEKRLLEENCGK